MKKYSILILGCLLLLGCKQEVLEPEQMIQGMFAFDDGSGLTDEYLDFEHGHITMYYGFLYPFAEGKIWHTDGMTFGQARENYAIRDGNIFTSSTLSGPVELKEGILTVGGKKYSALEGFSSDPYSSIVAEPELTFNFTDQDISIPFSIDRPIPAGEAGVFTADGEWITNLKVEGGAITGHLSATSTIRSGSIKLSYTHATDVWVTVNQAPSTFIRPASENLTLEYAASTQTLGYTIENPIATSTLTATANVSWISDIQVSVAQISFKVSDNNTGADRNGSIALSYAGAGDVTVPVTQKWAATSITMTPSYQTVDYAGGSFSFSYVVVNPRANTSVTVSGQNNWISDLMLSGNTISYKVAENNSANRRTGKIILTYGSYAIAEYDVMQSGRPVLSLTLNKSELALFSGASETLIATVNPMDAPLQWSSNKTSVATVEQSGKVTAIGNGTATISVKAGEKTATCAVMVTVLPEAVDLGLPSGLKWASFNLGASRPEEYGDYYAWGDIEPYYEDGHSMDINCTSWRIREDHPITGYNWESYKWGYMTRLTKYSTHSGHGMIDNITELQLVDDAARQTLGGNWRMPTEAEWEELISNCSRTVWTTYNGVKGCMFTSKKKPYNWIFLPAAGGWTTDSWSQPKGSYLGGGGYWSSSLKAIEYDGDWRAALLGFSCYDWVGLGNLTINDAIIGYLDRYKGCSVRPVTE